MMMVMIAKPIIVSPTVRPTMSGVVDFVGVTGISPMVVDCGTSSTDSPTSSVSVSFESCVFPGVFSEASFCKTSDRTRTN